MNELINGSSTKNEQTSSVFLVEQINLFRKIENNQTELLHKSLLSKIEKEFEDEIAGQNILPSYYIGKDGAKAKCYNLDFEQSLQLLMSESKTVRKECVRVIKSKQKPLSHLEVSLKLLQEQERQGIQLVALTAKVDAMQESYFSVQGYANLHKIKIDHVTCNKLGRKASKMSREDGAKIGKAKHQIFGEVNTYHEDILKDVFDEWLVSAL